jgi:hypothetical protein
MHVKKLLALRRGLITFGLAGNMPGETERMLKFPGIGQGVHTQTQCGLRGIGTETAKALIAGCPAIGINGLMYFKTLVAAIFAAKVFY